VSGSLKEKEATVSFARGERGQERGLKKMGRSTRKGVELGGKGHARQFTAGRTIGGGGRKASTVKKKKKDGSSELFHWVRALVGREYPVQKEISFSNSASTTSGRDTRTLWKSEGNFTQFFEEYQRG